MKKYLVTLTGEERQFLHNLAAAGKASASKQTHSRILLKADAGPDGPFFTHAYSGGWRSGVERAVSAAARCLDGDHVTGCERQGDLRG